MMLKKLHPKLIVIPNWLPQIESKQLMHDVENKLKRTSPKYLEGHFDGVIKGYRECLASNFDPDYNGLDAAIFPQEIVKRMQKEILETVPSQSLSKTFNAPHILDLRGENSFISPHIDCLKSSGGVICGLSLLSSSLIIFKWKKSYAGAKYKAPLKENPKEITVFLPPNSLYIQWDEMRYEYTHEIPIQNNHFLPGGQFIPRTRRVALLLRDRLPPS